MHRIIDRLAMAGHRERELGDLQAASRNFSEALGWWQGIVAMVGHAILYMFVLAPLINGLGHWKGAQNFGNTAYNSRILAWFTGGESLHNNHHAFPRAPRFSVRRSEFDPSWPLIRVLAALRLAVITGNPVNQA